MRKANIKKYEDIRAEMVRLEVILEQQQDDLKERVKVFYKRSHPLTIAAQFVTGSFKDVRNDGWVKMFNLVMYAYNQYSDVRSKGVDNPFMEMVLKVFSSISNSTEKDKINESEKNDENI